MRIILRAVVCVAVLASIASIASPAFAQQREWYSSQQNNIKFSMPGKWKTQTSIDKQGVPPLEPESPDGRGRSSRRTAR